MFAKNYCKNHGIIENIDIVYIRNNEPFCALCNTQLTFADNKNLKAEVGNNMAEKKVKKQKEITELPYRKQRDEFANKVIEFVKTLTGDPKLQTRILGRAYHLSNLNTRNISN